MNKFLLGLVLGTLLGFAFAELIRNDNIEQAAIRTDRSTARSADDAAGNAALSGAVSDARTSQNQLQTNARTSAPPTSPTPSASAPTANDQGPISAAPSPRTADTTPTAAPASRTPIAVPDAIKPFLEKKDTHDGLTLGQTHTKLEDEAEDLAWAYQMEIYLQQSFARPTKSGQPFDIRVIECRTSLCEIVGFSPLPNPTDDISAVVQQMSQQPWWDFDNFNTSAEGDDNGGKFLIFLRRKR